MEEQGEGYTTDTAECDLPTTSPAGYTTETVDKNLGDVMLEYGIDIKYEPILTHSKELESNVQAESDLLNLKNYGGAEKAMNAEVDIKDEPEEQLIEFESSKHFLCDQCGFFFHRQDELNPHMEMHAREKDFACDGCDYICDNQLSLDSHLKIKHPKERLLHCNQCCSQFDKSNELIHHTRQHEEEGFNCKPLRFRTITDHSEGRPFLCDTCGYLWTENEDLIPFSMRTHTGEQPSACEYWSAEKNLMNPLRKRQLPVDKLFFCNRCGSLFDGNDELIHHMRQHEEKDFNCDRCDYWCGNQISLHFHMIIDHSDDRPFLCDTCGCLFTKNDYLIPLDMNTHTVNKTCDRCEYWSTKRKLMNPFMNQQLPVVKLFICDQCGYSCDQKDKVYVHMRTHVRKKRFACVQCEFYCECEEDLIIHMKQHIKKKSFACNQCPYRCDYKRSLTDHMRMHIVARPFACDKCGYRSSHRRYLDFHMRMHRGEEQKSVE